MVGLQLREALLSRGDVDAILGFDSTMQFGLQKAGIKADDIRFLYYSDAGLDLYGNAILVSQKMRTENPDAVRRFVAVTARAWQAAIADPDAATAALVKQAPLVNAKLEGDKLLWLIKHQLVTPESRRRRPGRGARRPAGHIGRHRLGHLRPAHRAGAGRRVRRVVPAIRGAAQAAGLTLPPNQGAEP